MRRNEIYAETFNWSLMWRWHDTGKVRGKKKRKNRELFQIVSRSGYSAPLPYLPVRSRAWTSMRKTEKKSKEMRVETKDGKWWQGDFSDIFNWIRLALTESESDPLKNMSKVYAEVKKVRGRSYREEMRSVVDVDIEKKRNAYWRV